MIEEFQTEGMWWLPEKPDIKVPGKFSFSPQAGIILELNETFSSFRPPLEVKPGQWRPIRDLFPQSEILIILGQLSDGRGITLYQCHGGMGKIGRVRLSKFHAKFAFLGVPMETANDLNNFKEIQARYSFFEEWVDLSGISINVPDIDKEEIFVHYQRPQAIEVGIIDDLKISINFPITPFVRVVQQLKIDKINVEQQLRIDKINVEQQAYLRVDIMNDNNESFNRGIKLLREFRDFLGFAIGQPTQLLSVKAIDSKEYSFDILFSLDNSDYVQNQTLSKDKILFFRDEANEKLGTILQNWIAKSNGDFKYILQLILVNLYTKNLYIEYRFLNIVQALEAYHGKKYSGQHSGRYLPKEKFRIGIREVLLKALEDFPDDQTNPEIGITDKFRKKIEEIIAGLNSNYSLKDRLKELINDISDILPDYFLKEETKDNFISKTVTTRNAYTHHSESLRDKAATVTELYQITNSLEVILHIHLLKELGFDKNMIKKILARTRKYTYGVFK